MCVGDIAQLARAAYYMATQVTGSSPVIPTIVSSNYYILLNFNKRTYIRFSYFFYLVLCFI